METAVIEIPKCVLQFQKWNGPALKESLGGKPVVTLDGEGMFAEVAIMKLFQNSGWQARCISTVGRAHSSPVYISEWKDDSYANQEHQPIEDAGVLNLLERMVKHNRLSYTGCWDVVSWNEDTVLFTKVLRNNKDFIRKIHVNWLGAGLAAGLKPENFLLVQWDYNPRHLF